MATQSSILVWKLPWTEEPGELRCMGSKRDDITERLTYTALWLVDRSVYCSVNSESISFKEQERVCFVHYNTLLAMLHALPTVSND